MRIVAASEDQESIFVFWQADTGLHMNVFYNELQKWTEPLFLKTTYTPIDNTPLGILV
jgi:hypothetical protein